MRLIRKNASLIRTLRYEVFHFTQELDLGEKLCHLEKLRIPGNVPSTPLGNNALLKSATSKYAILPQSLMELPGHDHDDIWAHFAKMIEQNQGTLHMIDINGHCPGNVSQPSPRLWRAIADCSSRVRTLKITVGRQMALSSLRMIWKRTCQHLETFELHNYLVFNDLSGAVVGPFAEADECNIRHLRIVDVRGLDPSEQWELLIAPCRRLQTLVWSMDPPVMFSLSNVIEEAPDQWANIRSIEISTQKSTRIISDKQLAVILGRARRRENIQRAMVEQGVGYAPSSTGGSVTAPSEAGLCKLNLRGTECGALTFNVLRRTIMTPKMDDVGVPLPAPTMLSHFEILTELDVSHCTSVESHMVQEALASCPALRSIVANTIHVTDIASGDPWVCLGLRTWSIFIDVASNGYRSPQGHNGKFNELQAVAYNALGRLTELELLDLDYKLPLTRHRQQQQQQIYSNSPDQQTLGWQVKRGLGALKTLTQLKHVRFQKRQRMGMTMTSVEWMVQHWVTGGQL
ncbi:hypothetical protein BGZ94_002717, partial [Podila epigama]